MKTKNWTMVVVAMAMLTTVAMADNIVLNGSFEDPVQTADTYTTGVNPTSWSNGWLSTNLTYGGIVNGTACYGGSAPDGDQAIAANVGDIIQNTGTKWTLNETYIFSFYLAAANQTAANPVTAYLGYSPNMSGFGSSAYSETIQPTTIGEYLYYEYEFTPTADNMAGQYITLRFKWSAYALRSIDAVSLEMVPEPASVGLCVIGCVALISKRRRK